MWTLQFYLFEATEAEGERSQLALVPQLRWTLVAHANYCTQLTADSKCLLFIRHCQQLEMHNLTRVDPHRSQPPQFALPIGRVKVPLTPADRDTFLHW